MLKEQAKQSFIAKMSLIFPATVAICWQSGIEGCQAELGSQKQVILIMLTRLAAVLIAANILTTGVQGQTTAPYPPLVTDMAAHMEAYDRVNNPQAKSAVNKAAGKAVKPVARTSRYAKLLKTENDQDWKINSKVVTSIGMGLAAILGDDDDSSSTTTTTSTTE